MAKQMKLSAFFVSNSALVKSKPGALTFSNKCNTMQTRKRSLAEADNNLSGCSKNEVEACDSSLSEKLASIERDTFGVACNLGGSWLPVLESEFCKPYFKELSKFVASERERKTPIYPNASDVFRWTRECELDDVKVVILGQDPYHGPNQAHGLCFSVLPGVAIPPSLQNMYSELLSDIPSFQAPQHGYLVGWARQGVLLLNAVLTVREGQANSHQGKGWEILTDAVVRFLNHKCSGLVFILWGSHAQKKGSCISKSKHLVLCGVHPSPLSAHRGFFGCKHFSKTNAYLLEKGRKPIDWANLPVS